MLYAEKLCELDELDKGRMKARVKIEPLEQHLDAVVEEVNRRQIQESTRQGLYHEILITSAGILVLDSDNLLDFERLGWPLSELVPLDQLSIVVHGRKKEAEITDGRLPFKAVSDDSDPDSSFRLPERFPACTLSNLVQDPEAHFDLLFIPDFGKLVLSLTEERDQSLLQGLAHLAKLSDMILCEGSSAMLLAAAELLDGKRSVIPRVHLQTAKERFPRVNWIASRSFEPTGAKVRDGRIVVIDRMLGGERDLPHLVLGRGQEDPQQIVDKRIAEYSPPMKAVKRQKFANEKTRFLSRLFRALKEVKKGDDRLFLRELSRAAKLLRLVGFPHLATDVYHFCFKFFSDWKPDSTVDGMWSTVGGRPSWADGLRRISDAELLAQQSDLRDQLAPDSFLIAGFVLEPELDLLSVEEILDTWDKPDTSPEKLLHYPVKLFMKVRNHVLSENRRRAVQVDASDGSLPLNDRIALDTVQRLLERRQELLEPDDANRFRRPLSIGIYLAMKFGETCLARQMLELLAEWWADNPEDFCVLEILENALKAPGIDSLLQEGILSKPLGLTQEDAVSATWEGLEQAKSKLEEMRKGNIPSETTRPYTHLSMEQLLEKIDSVYRQKIQAERQEQLEEDEEEDKDEDCGLMAPSGATSEEISEVEKKLGEKLPEDFKEFLSLSDGLDQILIGDDLNVPGIKGCKDLEWDTEAEMDLMVEPELKGDCGKGILPKMEGTGCIDISDDGEENIWLVSPTVVESARDKVGFKGERPLGWRVLTWEHWTVSDPELYLSFREYLEHVLAQLEKA
ncbi:hypothetical protein IE53DRAFT_76873 [Violaceomyces palustris]|uniref:Uncharacterized protein n=1 Tax=Violaceomyces palustris TaxID=1673888 RepID=A0ACD0NYN5_9BASI|nr:hypothetical protein IE53DRAFT_76873 [Violaceomyces palustris]